MTRIKRLITNIQFWVWAAMHSEFQYFQIALYPGIDFCCGRSDYRGHPYIHISVYKPFLRYNVPGNYTAERFAKAYGTSTDELYTMDDIPF